jgi:flavin-dependent dehydrogenase
LAPVDVLIAGAGPAGCAAALALARFAPELEVVLVERTARRRPCDLEVLSPLAQPILAHLGCWPGFLEQGFAASHRTFGAWGAPAMQRREHLLDARGPSWRLDRPRFDRWLASVAGRGAALASASVLGVERRAHGWSVSCSDGRSREARMVIDATGRAGLPGRRRLTPVRRLDRLVAACAYGPLGDGPVELAVEPFADGWWYSLGVAEGEVGRRAVVCLTDADIARRLRVNTAAGWAAAVAQTRFIAGLVGGGGFAAPVLAPAAGQVAEPAAQDDLIPVGDAAAAFDPLCGQGVARALRSGVFAAYAVTDRLLRNDAAGLWRYRAWLASEARACEAGLREFYGADPRWLDQPFWRRRVGTPMAEETRRGHHKLNDRVFA